MYTLQFTVYCVHEKENVECIHLINIKCTDFSISVQCTYTVCNLMYIIYVLQITHDTHRTYNQVLNVLMY